MTAVLLRHAWAGDRAAWNADDRLRPLDERGRAQAEALRDALLERGVTRVVSSPYARPVPLLRLPGTTSWSSCL